MFLSPDPTPAVWPKGGTLSSWRALHEGSELVRPPNEKVLEVFGPIYGSFGESPYTIWWQADRAFQYPYMSY